MTDSSIDDPYERNEVWVGEERIGASDQLPPGISMVFHDRSLNNTVRFAANNRWNGVIVDLTSAVACTIDIGTVRVNFGSVRISFVTNSGRHSSNVSVSVGDGCIFNGPTHIIGPLTPGLGVHIGSNCLFAAHVSVRGSSHHGLWDMETGNLLNPEAGIMIGDHVWVGDQVAVLNKARIAAGSVVGARSVVNKSFDEEHVLLAGVPAAVRRRNVDWSNAFPLDNGAEPRAGRGRGSAVD